MEQVRVPLERELFRNRQRLKKGSEIVELFSRVGTRFLNEISNNGMKDAWKNGGSLYTSHLQIYVGQDLVRMRKRFRIAAFLLRFSDRFILFLRAGGLAREAELFMR